MKELAIQFIINLLNDLDFSGIIEQSTYNQIVESLTYEFGLSRREAQGLTTTTLKSLYVQKAG